MSDDRTAGATFSAKVPGEGPLSGAAPDGQSTDRERRQAPCTMPPGVALSVLWWVEEEPARG